MTGSKRLSISKLYSAELIVAVIVGAIILAFDVKGGISFWIGAFVMAVANGYFAWQVTRCQVMKDPNRAVMKFMTAELVKLVILGCGVIIIAKWFTVEWWAVVAGIVVSYFGLFVPVMLKWR